MLISYNGLLRLQREGAIKNSCPENVNGTSIDIVLGEDLLVETPVRPECPECGQPVFHGFPTLTDDTANLEMYCPHCPYHAPLYKYFKPVDVAKKEPLSMYKVSCAGAGYVLLPGHAVLGHSVEEFNLPFNLTAEYRLKSSMARVFLEHLHAGWCDPGWSGSVLTLELVNMSRYNPILLRAGMKAGQMCFYRHDKVPEEHSYATRGQYNNDKTVAASRGAK